MRKLSHSDQTRSSVETPFWQILKRAGFPPALSLLVWIPLIGLVVLYDVAFAAWKAVGNRNTDIP